MLESERLILRPWALADAPSFEALSADPEVMRYIGTGVAWSAQRSLEWIEKQVERFESVGYSFLAVLERETGELTGMCGVQRLGESEHIEIGWWVRRDRWGRGYATEGARMVRDWAFQELGVPQLIAMAAPGNEASTHVMRKIGMTFGGECEYADLGGHLAGIPVVYYRMTRPSDGAQLTP